MLATGFILREFTPGDKQKQQRQGSWWGKQKGLGQVVTEDCLEEGVLKMSRCQLGRGGRGEMFWHRGPHLSMHTTLKRASAERLLKHRWLGPTPRASDPFVRMKPMNLHF